MSLFNTPLRALASAGGYDNTYTALFEGLVLAANARHASVWNPAASGVILAVRGIQPINTATAAIVGTTERFEVKRITTIPTGGAVITPEKMFSGSPAVPASLVFQRGATGGAAEGTLLFPIVIGVDEVSVNSAGQTGDADYMPRGPGVEPFAFPPGEGFLVKQISAGVLGTLAFMVTFQLMTNMVRTDN